MTNFAGCRPEVIKFAMHMEKVLRENDHKSGWKNTTLEWLYLCLREEVSELDDVTCMWPRHKDKILKEAVDVANYCMMIADVTGGLD